MSNTTNKRQDSFLYKTQEEAAGIASMWISEMKSSLGVLEYNTTERDEVTGLWFATNRFDPNCDDQSQGYVGEGK